jgi:bacillithiol biosynthesis cysteine-adding enzyme BshC
VIANASSSSATSRPDARPETLLQVDLAATGLLAPLPAAFLAGRDRDLLAPLRFLPPGETPRGPALPGARRELAAALAVSNRGYGHEDADRLARKLADPATRVVVTGQQPGLFGGPLYAFAKMAAAARWAAALEAEGESAVAVFWVATEDHDWDEVASATFLTAEGPRRFDLGKDPAPLTPVGMRTLGPGVEEILKQLAEAIPGELYADWLKTLAQWYRPDARFGEAFSRLMVRLLGKRSPLLLDAMHPALKAAQRPWLRRLVERRQDIEEAFVHQDAQIEGRGYPLQIAPQRGASPLFLLRRGERRRVEWKGEDGYALRGRGGEAGESSVAELLQTIDENPGVVSPGALARPVLQDAVLGSFLQVLGPAEVAYLAQVAPVYRLLEVEAPWISLRPQTLVLEARQAERLADLGLTLADLVGDPHRLEARLAERAGADFVAPIRQRVEEALAELRGSAVTADPNLERPYDKTREQILRALDLFAEKATSSAARRDEVAARRIDQLRETCVPLGKLQERAISAAHFQGKYGDRLAESYWEQMDLDPRFLQVVSP